jgi:hypothetical protein
VARRWIGPRGLHILIAGVIVLALSSAILRNPAHGQSATAAGPQASSHVAVVPGFNPPVYSGESGVPAFPANDSQLSAFHFTELAADQVTPANLKSDDTVILYGIRWSSISSSGQAALNAFAATHKVVIWDADGTGAQNYSNFIHPFSDLASGATGKPIDSVVSFPSGVDFLASDKPSSPYYLDPAQLISSPSMINDMNAMKIGTKNWVPALLAQNKHIPKGGWVLAWSYGVIGNHTGLTVYSGIDADALGNKQINPNYAIKEVALDLKAPFRTTPDPACAPNCHLPSSGGGSTHASCSFAKPIPKHWVHGRVVVWLKTSVAAGITGRVINRRGKLLASGSEVGSNNVIRLGVRTKRLPTNRKSRLRAQVLVNGKLACSKRFSLKVDNTKPRLLLLKTWRAAGQDQVRLTVSEASRMTFSGGHVHYRAGIAAHRTINVHLPLVRSARLTLRDRAGNTVVRRLVWH